MTITYDNEANAAYIYVNRSANNSVVRTIPVSSDILVDLGIGGELLGIEILNASKHMGLNRPASDQIQILAS